MPYNHTKYTRKWRARNRDKCLEYERKWRQKNREKDREIHKRYRENNRKKINERAREWRINNPEKAQERDRKQDNTKFSRMNRYGTVERWKEAMLKYEGECTFACDEEAQLVHHMNGKSYRNSPKAEVNNDLSNLLPLCRACHVWLHNKTRRKKCKLISATAGEENGE